MLNRNNKPISILWEHLQVEGSENLIQQAIELILAELESESTIDGFDKIDVPGHAEDVATENGTQSKKLTTK